MSGDGRLLVGIRGAAAGAGTGPLCGLAAGYPHVSLLDQIRAPGYVIDDAVPATSDFRDGEP